MLLLLAAVMRQTAVRLILAFRFGPSVAVKFGPFRRSWLQIGGGKQKLVIEESPCVIGTKYYPAVGGIIILGFMV